MIENENQEVIENEMEDSLEQAKVEDQVEQTEQEEVEYTAEEYRDMFLALREKYDRRIRNKGSIEAEKIMKQAYTEVCELAVGGDTTAQCLLAYWFKHGNQALPENIELSMKWQMLSGANQNKHAIDKFAMFFSFIYDTIIFTQEFQTFSENYGLTEFNYKYCLAPMICAYVVKNMNIDAFDLTNAPLTRIEFNSVSMNSFTSLANKSVDTILEALRLSNEKFEY